MEMGLGYSILKDFPTIKVMEIMAPEVGLGHVREDDRF